jgi:transcriptional regulator with XRE-family HTH domain
MLAVDAGIDRTYVSRLERGLENPTVAVLEKLAGAFSSNIEELFSAARGRDRTATLDGISSNGLFIHAPANLTARWRICGIFSAKSWQARFCRNWAPPRIRREKTFACRKKNCLPSVCRKTRGRS